ncbi:MAG: MBL fold metallo-hydrolase [Burkholderiales bacterium]|jgi:glyoxylase-like metal-dependent hydrolase (beta-lactamase superfamily II)|nr:MBL fold metallo-hydrolase [Burkholderiales bacterium]
MQLNEKLHRLKMTFNVTPEMERFVYLYLIVGESIHLIDTGVRGSERIIAGYLGSLGRGVAEVKSILLTHSHPDHIGGAKAIKELSNGTIYACAQERAWIEDIDVQFRERPIPNFYGLVNQSVSVDKIIRDGDVLPLDSGVTIKVLDTKGHSQGSLSFLWIEENIIFTGDAIPVVGDIPIYISAKDSVGSLKKLLQVGANQYLSAWSEVMNQQDGENAIEEALALFDKINAAAANVLKQLPDGSDEEIVAGICAALKLEQLIGNPLFRKSVIATVNEIKVP